MTCHLRRFAAPGHQLPHQTLWHLGSRLRCSTLRRGKSGGFEWFWWCFNDFPQKTSLWRVSLGGNTEVDSYTNHFYMVLIDWFKLFDLWFLSRGFKRGKKRSARSPPRRGLIDAVIAAIKSLLTKSDGYTMVNQWLGYDGYEQSDKLISHSENNRENIKSLGNSWNIKQYKTMKLRY